MIRLIHCIYRLLVAVSAQVAKSILCGIWIYCSRSPTLYSYKCIIRTLSL